MVRVVRVKILLGAMGILLWATCGADAASFEGQTLQREGQAWSERSVHGDIKAQGEGWARIAGDQWGGVNPGYAIYEFHLPHTKSGTVPSLELSWYGQCDPTWFGVVVYVYLAESDSWEEVAWDSSRTEGWRELYPMAADTCLENNDGLTKVLKVKFETPGSWDSYRLRTVKLVFDYEDDSLAQNDLEASYACALAAVQVDQFNTLVLEYDPEEKMVNGEIVWMGISSVLQFARHVQGVVDPSSLLDLVSLPSNILGLYNDIFGFGLFQPIDVERLNYRYMVEHGGPKSPSMSSYLTRLRGKFRETARRLGGHETQAGSNREGSLKDLHKELFDQGVDYYLGGEPHDSLSGHASEWEKGWHWAAEIFTGDVNNMGVEASKVGTIMQEFGDAWISSFVDVNLSTKPEGLSVELNGSPDSTPQVWHSIKGVSHTISAPSEAELGGNSYHFVAWNGGEAQSHVISPTVDHTYVAEYERDTGSLQITISPQAAIDAGAAWKLTTELTWHPSGYTLTEIFTGQVEVEYKSAAGWTRPVNDVVEIERDMTTPVLGVYEPNVGYLRVVITPQPAVSAGAKWKLTTDEIWHGSGSTTIYAAGTHTLEFKSIPNWDEPPERQVEIVKNETTEETGLYSRHTGSLQITISPQEAADAGAAWKITTESTWHPSEYTLSGIFTGEVEAEYKSISGWAKPANEFADIEKDTTAFATSVYTPLGADMILVDDDYTPDTPGWGIDRFAQIQEAIDDADDGQTVVVRDGTYTGPKNRDIDFRGKAITLRSENGPENCIIDCQGSEADPHRGFLFRNGEDENSVVQGITITNGFAVAYDRVADQGGGGICCIGDSGPTIYNCRITNCVAKGADYSHEDAMCDGGGIFNCEGPIINCTISENSCPDYPCFGGPDGELGFCDGYGAGLANCSGEIRNCTIVHNTGNGALSYCSALIENCIIWDNSISGSALLYACSKPSYSCIQYVPSGFGNIDVDPCFVDSAGGDYHLKSQAGRWDPVSEGWFYNNVTSPCIDAGNPGSPLGDEPAGPNNVRINMGAYGGTAEASKTPDGWGILADLTNDRVVDFSDFSAQAEAWQRSESEQPGDLDRNGKIDFNDLKILAGQWLVGYCVELPNGGFEMGDLEHWTVETRYAASITVFSPGLTEGNYCAELWVYSMPDMSSTATLSRTINLAPTCECTLSFDYRGDGWGGDPCVIVNGYWPAYSLSDDGEIHRFSTTVTGNTSLAIYLDIGRPEGMANLEIDNVRIECGR